eukprot:TRINITY_DN651_c0_g1_i10.p1 TRINITY_DN651_c0_g1~~TRINITY_DN651_c0_g1_i10.p1  ORF type:complete len:1417 (+),score=268.43 TRINITY_DN651_c0_g1_i10:51-4253(+)
MELVLPVAVWHGPFSHTVTCILVQPHSSSPPPGTAAAAAAASATGLLPRPAGSPPLPSPSPPPSNANNAPNGAAGTAATNAAGPPGAASAEQKGKLAPPNAAPPAQKQTFYRSNRKVFTGSDTGEIIIWNLSQLKKQRLHGHHHLARLPSQVVGTTSAATSAAASQPVRPAPVKPPGAVVAAGPKVAATMTAAGALQHAHSRATLSAGTLPPPGCSSSGSGGAWSASPAVLLIARSSPVVALALAVTEFHEVLASLSQGPSLRFWSIDDGHCVGECPSIATWITVPSAMVTLPTRRHIAIAGDCNNILVVDVYTRKVTSEIRGHNDWVCSMFCLSHVSSTMASAGHRRSLSSDVAPTPVLVTASRDGAVMLWRHTNQAQQADLLLGSIAVDPSTPVRGLCLSPNQLLLLVVFPRSWTVYRAVRDGAKLFSSAASQPQTQTAVTTFDGGSFIDNDTFSVWTRSGVCTVRRLVNKPEGVSCYVVLGTKEPPAPEAQCQWLATGAQPGVQPRPVWRGAMAPGGAFVCCGGGQFPNLSAWKPHRAALAAPTPASPQSFSLTCSILEGWKGCDIKSTVTCSCVLEDVLVLICGHRSGEISMRTLPTDPYPRTVQAHSSRVTALLAPPPRSDTERLLVSAGADFCIKIWELFSLTIKYVFCTHSGPVARLFLLSPPPMPPDQGERYSDMNNSFLSVGEDRCVGIFSLDTCQCQRWFYGHPAPITKIHWNVYQDYMLITCSDGSLTIWEMTSGRLVSRLSGPKAVAALSNYCIPILKGYRGNDIAPPAEELGITSCSINLGRTPDNAPLQVLLLNIRRISKLLAETGSPSTLQRKYQWSLPRVVTCKNEVPGPTVMDTSGSEPKAEVGERRSVSPTGSIGDLSFRYPPFSILSYLLTWGLDDVVDNLCKKELFLRPPSPPASFGLVGEGLTMSFLFPCVSAGGKFGQWQTSAHMSGSLQLAAVTLAKTLLQRRENSGACSQLLSFFCAILPDAVPGFEEPSLSLMTTFWSDISIDVMQSARSLFSSTVDRLSSQQLTKFAETWGTKIKNPEPGSTSSSLAVLMLAILGSKHPAALDKQLASLVGRELLRLLSVDSVTPVSAAAVELLAQGMPLWLSQMSAVEDQTELVRRLFALVMLSDKTSPVGKAALQALTQFAQMESKKFIEVMDGELMARKNNVAVLSLLNKMVSKYSRELVVALPQFVDAICHSIDPRAPIVRENSLRSALDLFTTLDRVFPQVLYSSELLRVAVGAKVFAPSNALTPRRAGEPVSSVYVYDLRAAAPIYVCQGNVGGVSAVSLSPNGKVLAAYNSSDGVVRLFNLGRPSTMMGLVTLREPDQVCAIEKMEDALVPTPDRIRLRWQPQANSLQTELPWQAASAAPHTFTLNRTAGLDVSGETGKRLSLSFPR